MLGHTGQKYFAVSATTNDAFYVKVIESHFPEIRSSCYQYPIVPVLSLTKFTFTIFARDSRLIEVVLGVVDHHTEKIF